MIRFHKDSFWLGTYVVGILWTVTMVTTEDTRTANVGVYIALLATLAFLAVWTIHDMRRRRGASPPAHIDTEGVYAAVRCSGCSQHLMYLEHGHDLARLMLAKERHACKTVAGAGDGGGPRV